MIKQTIKKTALITGASAGFGEACAKKFALNGWRLILAARREERLRDLAEQLRLETEVHISALDVRSHYAVTSFISSLPYEFKEIDLLVNNAGLALGLEPAHEAKMDNWESMVDTNIKGLMYLTHAVLPGMVRRNTGHVINIGSTAGNWPYAGGNTYGATKAFVSHFSRNLRSDLLGKNIRVTCIEPGMAESEFSLVRYQGDAERAANVYRGTKPLTPEDIAETVYWVSNLPAHVNVNTLEVMPVCQAWAPLMVKREEG